MREEDRERFRGASEPPAPKEVQLRPGIDRPDPDTKIASIERFLASGARTKVTVRFRGREMRRREP
jgi:translation initiation factor IF-3